MIDTITYSKNLEKKLIDKFVSEFEEKVGYRPIVVTRIRCGKRQIQFMSLTELESCFEMFLPEKYGKTIPLAAKVRYRELVELRMIFCYLARKMNYTLTSIGEFLGGRDHTTIMYNITEFTKLFNIDENMKEKTFLILQELKTKFKYDVPIMEQSDTAWLESEPDLLPELLPEQNHSIQDN